MLRTVVLEASSTLPLDALAEEETHGRQGSDKGHDGYYDFNRQCHLIEVVRAYGLRRPILKIMLMTATKSTPR